MSTQRASAHQDETPDTLWRVFIAVPVPPAVREHLRSIIASLAANRWPVRWTNPDLAHITLHFLGELPIEDVELARLALESIVRNHESFDLRTADPGAFPSIRKPRVLWLGLWGPAHRLETIYNEIGDALDAYDFEIEDAEFRPHLTLGRLRQQSNARLTAEIRQALDRLKAQGIASSDRPVPLPVREIQLLRSHLSADGPSYEVLASYPLSKPEQPA